METKICARSAKSHFLTTGFFRTFSVLLCFLTIAAAASADVILTDRAAQSVAGQNFTFTFTPVQPSDGSDGTFTIRARGDYGTGVASEYLTWDIDGIMSDTSSPYYGATVLHSYNSNDVEWQQAFVVSGADLVAMTSDSVITITVDLSSAVDYQIDPARHYVEVTLAYNSGSGGCLLPPAPSGPVPADGAIDVPVDTNLAWNSAGGGGDHIVINELFMHSGDWLELFNPTGSSVNLTGWQVIARRNTDTTTFILPAFVLAPGAYVVLHETSGINTSTDLYFGMQISWTESPGSCALLDASGTGVDFVRWSDSSGSSHSSDLPPAGTNWTGNDPRAPTNQSRNTLARDGLSTDTDNGSDWENTCGVNAGSMTPGSANVTAGATLEPASVAEPNSDPDITFKSTSDYYAAPGPVVSGRSPEERQAIAEDATADPDEKQPGEPTVGPYPVSAFESRTAAATTVQILVFSGHSDNGPGDELENTLNAIAQYFANFSATLTTTESASALAAELTGKDVFLIPEQESWTESSMAAWGANIAAVLQNFVTSGGVVIVADDGDGGHSDTFVNNTGLMTVGGNSGAVFSTRSCTVQQPLHPIMAGVPASFSTMNGNTSYPGFTNGTVLATVSADPIVIARDVGAGGIVLIGWDYFDYNNDMARIIANAVQWGGAGGPIPPVPPGCNTTYDVYLGTDPCVLDLVFDDINETSCEPALLQAGITYYWKVCAGNSAGERCGPIWSFTTRGCSLPPTPSDPDPCNGAVDVPMDTNLAWGGGPGGCPGSCGLTNGGFESGFFPPWTTVTGPGTELTQWSVQQGTTSGYFRNGEPFEGSFFAGNGFDGEAGLFYDIYQEVAIPSCAGSAILSWSERIQWDLTSWGAIVPRQYVVSVQPAGGGAALAVLHTMQLMPGTEGDTGYVSHSVDLLSAAAAIAGQTVRINFHEYIPETNTGPAQFDLDGISLTCDGVLLVPTATGAEDSIIASSTVGSATLDAEYGHRREIAFAAALVEAGVRIGDESIQIKDEAEPEPNSAGHLVAASSGGPDAGGYTFIDSDEPGGPFFDWIDIGSTGINLGLGDDSHYFPVGLPFNFDFYGVNYNQLAVGSNGTVYFEDDYLGLTNVCIPGTNGYGVGRFIAVYWDDLYPSGADNVYYQIVGSAPNRVLVVQWQNVRHYGSSTERVTAQVQLFEGSSDILLLYANPSSEAGSGATVGIQKDPVTGLQYLCNQSRLHSNLAVLFTRGIPPSPGPGTCPTSYDVYFGTDANDMNLIDADINEAACDPTPEPAGRLNAHTTYFWQVIAKNATGETAGPNGIDCWHFTTENTPPVADAGPDQNDVEGQCNTPQGTQVTLDGSGSYDEDGDALTYTWTGPIVGSPVNGPSPTVTLSDGCPGDYIINLDVNDEYDDANDQVVIRVVDTTPPEFNLSVSPAILWPPNHKLCLITPEWTLHDNCDELPDVSLVNIVMNEGDETDTYDPLFDTNPGDGHTIDDIQVHTDGSIYLRAERSGTGTGRVYTITYQAVDDSGNVTQRSAVVVVPHDQSAAGGGPDVNADGVVNLKDFAKLARYWLQNEPSVDIMPLPSGDGVVDGEDLTVLMQQWMSSGL